MREPFEPFMTDEQTNQPQVDRPRADEPAGGDEQRGAGAATATKTRPAKPSRKVEHLPPWRVLLHNDDVNDQLYVVESITKITPLGLKDAARCMLEAHITGVSMLLVTHRERAELYKDQFHSKGLTVTIEPTE